MNNDQRFQEVDSILNSAYDTLLEGAGNKIHDAFSKTRISILKTRRQLHEDLDAYKNPNEHESMTVLIKMLLAYIVFGAVVLVLLMLSTYLMDVLGITNYLDENFREIFGFSFFLH